MVSIVVSLILAYIVFIYLMGACYNKDPLWFIKSESWEGVNGDSVAALMAPVIIVVCFSVAVGTHSLLQ